MKRLLIFFLFFLGTHLAYTQKSHRVYYDEGFFVNGGIGVANHTGSSNAKGVTSILLGAGYKTPLFDVLDLVISANYHKKGSNNYRLGSYPLHLQLDYLTIPALIKFSPNDAFSIGSGVGVGMLANTKSKDFDRENSSINFLEQIEQFDVFIPIEVEWKPAEQIGVGVRYDRSITPVRASATTQQFNTVFMGTITAYFPSF